MKRSGAWAEQHDLSSVGRRSGPAVWTATIDHFKMGEHVLEKAKFDLQSSEVAIASNDPVQGCVKTLTLTEALDSGVVNVAGRKGLNGRVIMLLTRTESAPVGPMHVSVPVGTVLFVDDGKEEPMRLYPFYDQRIDLFGQVADGCRCPCFMAVTNAKS